MIHARIDTVEHRKIVGFETGTRAKFDRLHARDPLWVFLDSFRVKYRIDFKHFLKRPWNYRIDTFDNLYLSDNAPILPPEVLPTPPAGYALLRGADGKYLRGKNGIYLHGLDKGYESPPEGFVYLRDDGVYYLRDSDGSYITEEE